MGDGKAAGAFVAVLIAAFVVMNVLPAEGLVLACAQEAVLALAAIAGVRFACPRSLAFSKGKRCTGDVQRSRYLRHVGIAVVLVGAFAGTFTLVTWCFGDNGFAGELASAEAPAGFEAVRRIALLLVVCVLTGVFEESFARVLCIEAFEGALRSDAVQADTPQMGKARSDVGQASDLASRAMRASSSVNQAARTQSPTKRAVLLSALFFALLHVGVPAAGVNDAVLLQSVLKFAQSLLFGLTMGVVYVRLRRLRPCVAIHACFDVLYLGPQTVLLGALPETYASGMPFDTVMLGVTTVLLMLVAVVAWKERTKVAA